MKFSTTLALSAAPLAMAKAVQNAYPGKREPMLAPRKPQLSALSAELAALGLSGLGVTPNAATEVALLWVNPGAGAGTTIINNFNGVAPPAAATAAAVSAPPAASAAAAAPAAATTHQVMVGGAAGLVYTPAEIQAAVGDMVVFTFMNANHTVTQSAFTSPCVAMAGGMDSGFQANPNNTVNPPPQVAMQVMVDTPLWFYCKQTAHCGKGMTFSINPTAAKTQAMFQSMAIAQNGTGAPTALTGGAAAAPPAAAPPAAAAASNSTGAGAAAAAPPAAAAPAASGSGAAAAAAGTAAGASTNAGTAGSAGVTTGQGTLVNGQCQCAVSCASGSFPAANVQGVGAFGGTAGSLPMAMSEPVINAA